MLQSTSWTRPDLVIPTYPAQGVDKWGEAPGCSWEALRAASPGYPLDGVKRSQRRPKPEARLVPNRVRVPAYCELCWRPRAVSGSETLRIDGPVLVCAANGKGKQPREEDFDIHFCATGKAMRTGGAASSSQAARPCKGPGSLTDPCVALFLQRLPLTARGRIPSAPRHGRGTRSIFLVELADRGLPLPVRCHYLFVVHGQTA